MQQQKLEKEQHPQSNLQVINLFQDVTLISPSLLLTTLEFTQHMFIYSLIPSRMTAYHMCSVLLFLSLIWVDLGSLQHLNIEPIVDKSQNLEFVTLTRKNSILYINFLSTAWQPLRPTLSQCLEDNFTKMMLISYCFFPFLL